MTTHLEGGSGAPQRHPTPPEARLMREALGIPLPCIPPPRSLWGYRGARALTCASADTERARVIAEMQRMGWLHPVAQVGAPASVRPSWVVTQKGLDALRAAEVA